MSKDNILFSVIGVLLGFIVGFMFANSYNQKGYAPRAQAPATASQTSGLPADHPAIPTNGVADQQGMQAAVQETIQKAKNEPDNFDAQMMAASYYYRVERYDEAIDFLMRANKIRPDDYPTVVRLGDANFDAGRYETAESWYTAALVKKPDDVNVRTDLGTTFLARKPSDPDRAIKEYRRSLEIDPKHEKTLHNLFIAYKQKGDVKEAQAALDRLAEVNPNNEELPQMRSELAALNSGSKPK
jgi:tetratricopeptide (TPR) repeat protein